MRFFVTICAAMGFWALGAFAAPWKFDPKGGAVTEKDEIFHMIEGCRPNAARDEPGKAAFAVSCLNKCIERKLNFWFSRDPANREVFYSTQDVYEIERLARLQSCRSGKPIYEQTSCLGQFAPDIVEKLGTAGCLQTMPCDVKFDIDDDGRPINSVASCAPSAAKAEFEREAICLVKTMNFRAYRGRKNVVQPFEMALGGVCPIS